MESVYDLAKKNYGRTWTIEMLQVLVNKGKLSVDEYTLLTNSSAEDLIDSLSSVQASKLNELSNACEETIYDGIDVTTSQGTEHFSLTIDDQINIQAQAEALKNGAIQVPYHADGKSCRMFISDEINAILSKSYVFKTFQTTYFNKLKVWVNRCTTIADVNAIKYGSSLPDDLDDELNALTGKSSIENK